MANVYLNGPTLATSTGIFQDWNLSVPAPDGYYSNGTIVRQWLAGVLLPPQNCPSCAQPCGNAITANGGQGVYTLSIGLGTDTGAVIISFNPQNIPDGILVEYDGVFYNSLSSPIYGYLASSVADEPVFVGRLLFDCGIVAGSPYTVDVYDYVSGSFTPTGGTQNISVASGQMALTTNGPGDCIMVIPKPNATPSTINISCFGLCTGTVFNIGVSCPAPLQTVAGSRITDSPDCGASIDRTYYTSVLPADIMNNLKYRYAYIFTDINGEFPLAAGNYTIVLNPSTPSTSTYTIVVDSHGIITGITICP